MADVEKEKVSVNRMAAIRAKAENNQQLASFVVEELGLDKERDNLTMEGIIDLAAFLAAVVIKSTPNNVWACGVLEMTKSTVNEFSAQMRRSPFGIAAMSADDLIDALRKSGGK